MTIHIEAYTFDVIIGLLDFERKKAQSVVIDLEASYLYKKEHFINYAEIHTLLRNHLIEQAYILLEDALLGLKEQLISLYPQMTSLSLKIAKPHILPLCSVALSEHWDFK